MKSISQTLKKSGIYCIINITNQKKYIGSSINMYQRLLKHRSCLRKNYHQNRKLQNSWNKYNENYFDYYILEYCNEDILEQQEQFYIDTLKPELNITLIVERNILSKESRLLQSETRKRKIKSGEIKLPHKVIHKYGLEGNFIESYDGVKIAATANNIAQSSIHRYLSGIYRKGGNFLWSYDKKETLDPYIKIKIDCSKWYKAVKVIDSKTEEIVYKFNSIKECALYFKMHSPSITHAIKVKQHFKRKYYILFNI